MYADNESNYWQEEESNYWQEEFELYGFSDEEIGEIWDSYDD